MEIHDFVRYLKNDLDYMEGVADAINSPHVKSKVTSMRQVINKYLKEQGLNKLGHKEEEVPAEGGWERADHVVYDYDRDENS